MIYHPLVNTIKDLLTRKWCWFETFEHEEVRTSEEAARTRPGYSLSQGAKALIVRKRRGDEKSFAMVVIPGDERFDNMKAKTLLQAKDIRFATEEEVFSITSGVKPGGVPPFGNLFGLEVYADRSLFSQEKIVFNAGDRRLSLAMKAHDYQQIVQPRIGDIV